MRSIRIIFKSLVAFTALGLRLFWFRQNPQGLTRAGIAFRKYFEQVGGMYVKFGQILSLRRDVLPDEVCSELRKLLDEVPQFPLAFTREVIEKDLGKKIEEIFSEFIEKPLASASLGQVYKAKLQTGEQVVVKVLRPQIRELVAQDLKLLRFVAAVVDFLPGLNIRLYPIALEFSDWMQVELDYRIELDNLQKFHAYETPLLPIFNIPLKTKVPQVFPELSSDRLLVMEFISGKTVNEIIRLVKQPNSPEYVEMIKEGYNPVEIGKQIRLYTMKQCFIDGFFNADPHPANIIATPDNQIYFIDFGLVGRLTRKRRMAQFKFGRALALLEKEEAFIAVKELLDLHSVRDEERLKRAVEEIVERLANLRGSGKTTYAQSSQDAMQSLLLTFNKHRVQIPRDVAIALRAILIGEGIVTALDPNINFNDATRDLYRVTLAATYLEMRNLFSNEGLTKFSLKAINFLEREVFL
jgi:ubiquinone biosynthesis protein